MTIFLGITIACQMQADKFLQKETLLILGLGLIAFIFDTAGGVLFAKILNLFLMSFLSVLALQIVVIWAARERTQAQGLSALPSCPVCIVIWFSE